MASIFTDLLGKSIVNKDGEIFPTSSLAKKECVGIYFSAHWCPPCRNFTPKLAATYRRVLEDGKDFEIVFVSSDRDEDAFQEYFAEMPWKALPYADRERKAALSKKFKVSGIPTLILLDGSGQVITTKGTEGVRGDEEGRKFPWIPPTVNEALGNDFVNKSGDKVEASAFAEKTVGLYFSAHWCPPCRMFTPKLAEAYEALKAKGTEFEIIFASSDRDQESFQEYLDTMPWLAIPHGDDRKDELSSLFDVSGIPQLVILDKDRKVVNANALSAVRANPEGFPWMPPAVLDLNTMTDPLNEAPCLIALVDKASHVLKSVGKEVLTPLAEKLIAEGKAKEEDPSMYIYLQEKESPVMDQIRDLCKLKDDVDVPQLVMLDVPDEAYYVHSGEFNEEGVKDFLSQYKAKTLTRHPLR